MQTEFAHAQAQRYLAQRNRFAGLSAILAATSVLGSAQEELLKWLGDNGRYLVSTRITEKTFDHLEAQDVKGRIPCAKN